MCCIGILCYHTMNLVKNLKMFQKFSLMLLTGWSDFRYYLPLNLATVFIIIFIATIENKKGVVL